MKDHKKELTIKKISFSFGSEQLNHNSGRTFVASLRPLLYTISSENPTESRKCGAIKLFPDQFA